MAASNITAAALFRAVEKFSPTLLIDEADTFLKGSDELRGILNSGHNRATAYVVRTTGEDYEPRLFGTWSPKAVAMIGQLPDTLASRAIEIRMRRIPPGASVEELRAGRLQYLEPFQRQAWTWGQDHIELLRAADPCMPNGMRGRTADNWRPLLAIADALGDDWPQRARDAAQAYCASVGEQPKGVQLLADIREILVDHAADRIPSADLASKLGHMEDRSWPEWRDGKPITTRQVARLLAPFGVAPRTIRFEADSAKGYFVSDFTDAFLRYLPDRSVTALQTRETGSSEPDPSVTECFGVTDGKEGNTLPTGRCDGVTDQEADLGETSEVEVEL